MQKDTIKINKDDNKEDNWFIKDLDLAGSNLIKKPPKLVQKMYANAKRSNVKKVVAPTDLEADLKSYNKKRFKGKTHK